MAGLGKVKSWDVECDVLICGYGCAGASAAIEAYDTCLLYTSPSPRDQRGSRMPSSA